MSSLGTSLGPMLFLWDKERLDSFYKNVAQSDVDIVYFGESVCGKRRLSRLDDYLHWAQLLAQSGKEVVL